MGEPPSDAGAVKVIEAWAFPAVAVPMAGAPGTAIGVTGFEDAEATPGPFALVALTVKEYAVPLARPVTVIDVHGTVQVPVKPPGEDVAA